MFTFGEQLNELIIKTNVIPWMHSLWQVTCEIMRWCVEEKGWSKSVHHLEFALSTVIGRCLLRIHKSVNNVISPYLFSNNHIWYVIHFKIIRNVVNYIENIHNSFSRLRYTYCNIYLTRIPWSCWQVPCLFVRRDISHLSPLQLYVDCFILSAYVSKELSYM